MLAVRGQWAAINRKESTHICKLRYYVLALIMSVKPVACSKVFGGGDYRLFVVGGVGAVFQKSRRMVALAAQKGRFGRSVGSLCSLIQAVG